MPERRVRVSESGAGPDDAQSKNGDAGYDYRRESPQTFDAAVATVEGAIRRNGFRVRVVHDIQATLAAKGFTVKPIRIYEVECDDPTLGAIAGESGMTSSDARLAKLFPCRVNVFVEHDNVVVTALRPTLLCRVFPEDGLEASAGALERRLLSLVDDAAA
jgi:uncharacterized protein (DUF302 family)